MRNLGNINVDACLLRRRLSRPPAERACELTQFKEPMLIGTLAAACAEAGRFEDAVNAAHKARELALAAGLEQVAEKNRELTEWFKARKAYREPR